MRERERREGERGRGAGEGERMKRMKRIRSLICSWAMSPEWSERRVRTSVCSLP